MDFHICLGATFPVGISICTLERGWGGGGGGFTLMEGYACVNFLFGAKDV